MVMFECRLGEACRGCHEAVVGVLSGCNDVRGFGLSDDGSPAVADVLLVTGAVRPSDEQSLRRSFFLAPDRVRVVSLGDCSLGVRSDQDDRSGVAAREVLPVGTEIPGCPPSAERIEAVFREIIS